MQSEFDLWNDLKQEINVNSKNKFVKEGGVYWCYLGLNIGSEQNGKGIKFERPILVVKRLNHKSCIVLPLTTSYKNRKLKIKAGLIKGKRNYVILSQIRLIDTKRITNFVKVISRSKYIETTKTVSKMFERSL